MLLPFDVAPLAPTPVLLKAKLVYKVIIPSPLPKYGTHTHTHTLTHALSLTHTHTHVHTFTNTHILKVHTIRKA